MILEVGFKLPLVIFGIVMIVLGALNIGREGELNGCISADRLPMLVLMGGALLIVGIALRTILGNDAL